LIAAPMASAPQGQPAAGEELATLHEQNYFTNKHAGDGEPAYEYHPLFRDFLLSQALRVYSPADCARIRRTAAALLDAAGQIDPAARLLRDAKDWDTLGQLVRRHAQSLVAQGGVGTLEEGLAGIPTAIVAEQPWLLFWRGWIVGRHADRQRSLEQAFIVFRRDGDTLGCLLAWAAVIFGFLS